MSHADDHRPGPDASLHALYALVPDAYELDLLEEARQQRDEQQFEALLAELAAAWRVAVAGLGYEPAPEPTSEAPAPSVTQARFLVERLLGGVVVDDDAR